MYTRTALAWLTTAATTLALSGIAFGDPGKSPNGPPGPEGNPTQPQSAQQDPPAKQESAPNGEANGHAKSESKDKPSNNGSKGKSKPKSNHSNPSPGTPRKGGREDRPAPKITICHATGSEKNPYVTITISRNGLNGHEGHHKGDGRWDDIIPAPAGGCPSSVPGQQPGGEKDKGKDKDKDKDGKITICHATGSETNPYVVITISVNGLNGHGDHEGDIIPAPAGGCPANAPTQTPGGGNTPTTTTTPVAQPERATDPTLAPAAGGVLGAQAEGTPTTPGTQAVLGEQAEGGSNPAGGVLGAQAEGGSAPAAARETRRATVGSLPFTGFELAFVVIVGLTALLGGFALRRAAMDA